MSRRFFTAVAKCDFSAADSMRALNAVGDDRLEISVSYRGDKTLEGDIALILDKLDAGKLPTAIELVNWPDSVRGFGHVREKSALAGRRQREILRAQFAS